MTTNTDTKLNQKHDQIILREATKPAQAEVVFLKTFKTTNTTSNDPTLKKTPIMVDPNQPNVIPLNEDKYNRPSQPD